MIKITKVGTLASTGEIVYQHDAGNYRIFKTAKGKEVAISEVSFVDGPVKPVTATTEPVTKETPAQDAISGATVELMEAVNEEQE